MPSKPQPPFLLQSSGSPQSSCSRTTTRLSLNMIERRAPPLLPLAHPRAHPIIRERLGTAMELVELLDRDSEVVPRLMLRRMNQTRMKVCVCVQAV